MASGNKVLFFGTRERAVSTDLNRAQAFAGAHAAEVARWWLSYVAGEGGAGSLPATTTAPLTAIVVNGLVVRPEIGTVNLFVEPGLVCLVNPDATPSADDSPFKIVLSAGEQTAGALTLTAGGGGTRIDVIECRRVDVVAESASRDIYDPSTGTFAAAVVDKVRTSTLEFRIRTGTPGGGFPGTASGWLPLAVASVPSVASTWNDVTLWDVRPLLADLRANTPVQANFPKVGRSYGSFYVDGSDPKLFGVFETEINQWRAGGEIGSALSGFSGGALVLDDASVIEPGLSPVSGLPIYVYAAFPFGLPRWARLSPSTSGQRVPVPFRGIPIHTDQGADFRGRPTAPIALPTGLGLGGNTSEAVLLAATAYKSGANVNASIADGWTFLADFLQSISPASGANTPDPIYEVQDGTHFPRGATAIRVRVTTTLTGTPTDAGFDLQRSIRCLDAASNVVAEVGFAVVSKDSKSTGVTSDWFEVDVPLHAISNMPTGSAVIRRLTPAYSINGVVTMAHSNQSLRVVGWRMGA